MAADVPQEGSQRPTLADADVKIEKMRAYLRSHGRSYLEDPNISSVGIGYKVKDGKRTEELCLQFTVKSKRGDDKLEALGTTSIPKTIQMDDWEAPTDVIQREYHASYKLVALEQKSDRKQRRDTLVPGISVSHPAGTAGTLGAIVYDQHTGQACMLSNWHVLNTPRGKIGDPVVQPGPYDDNRVTLNRAGKLVRSHLGLAGDCAIASIENRGFDPTVMELDARPLRLGRPELGDLVVKSGRTTGVTYGRVRRIETTVKIDYGEGDLQDLQHIGGFEIGPAEDRPADQRQISGGGDSGSIWLIAGDDGTATDVMVGLHFAGEGNNDPDDHAIACYAHSVCEKLEIALAPPVAPARAEEAVEAAGYDPEFLGYELAAPTLSRAGDAVSLNGSCLLPYTHFSVCLSKERRMAHFVAWNIDGGKIKCLSRNGLEFTYDARIPERYQVGDEMYADNRLDRGHLARRADLCWGSRREAMKANRDSFYFTNITPQHQSFNQSQRHGLWGLLENAIFEDVEVEGLRVSAMAGPVFKDRDLEYRGLKVPSEFWKLVAYVDSEDNRAKVKAYVLTQDDLLNDIEALQLDPFRLYQISIAELERRLGLDFGDTRDLDAFVPESVREGVAEGAAPRAVREVLCREDLL